MAFDGFVTRAIVHELSQKLLDSRIYKIYQPHKTDLVFVIRGHGKNLSLLLSANPTYPRIHIANRSFSNPVEPPMFCMLLRKHLEGGIIESIKQIDNERIIYIDLKVRDELGDFQTKRLIIEIMGRHSNIILIQPEKNMILDGINHVTSAISSYRQILPGKAYVEPPSQNKLNPLTVEQEVFYSAISFNEGKIDKQLINKFTGISPTIAKEILYQSGLPTKENLWKSFHAWMEKTNSNQYEPSMTIGTSKPDFSIFPLSHLDGEAKSYGSMNACIEDFYDQKAERDTVRQKAHDLSRFLMTEKNKNEKKIEYLLKDLESAKNADQFKLYGELLTANMHQITRGAETAEVINYYDENQSTLSIPLDPFKTPSENAQMYFKKYNKLKTSTEIIEEQLEITKQEIEYLESVLALLDNASVEDIEEIREELIEQDYLKEKRKRKPKRKKNPDIERFQSSEGHTIYVGKNNKQNEYLTHKVASSSDTWLHTKDIPGSHVVIKAKEFGDKTLEEAAILAAYFSKAKFSSHVPVDYTLIKHVKKPSGAKPGYVIYENQKTLYITPDEATIKQLKHEKP